MTELGPITYYKGKTWEEIQENLGSAGLPIPPIEITIAPLDGLDAADRGKLLFFSFSFLHFCILKRIWRSYR